MAPKLLVLSNNFKLMWNPRRPLKFQIFRCPAFDYFYSLQNISFCGAHPKQLRYFGFITKHPLLPRFACHVFLSESSTQPIVESIGSV